MGISIHSVLAVESSGSHRSTDDATVALDQLLQGFHSLKADFTQTVINGKGVSQKTTGSVWIQKPGQFRWEYQHPAQLFISNGQTLWFYDEDLAQVTIKKAQEVVSGTPAELLSSKLTVGRFYQVRFKDASDHSTMVLKANPSNKNSIKELKMSWQGSDLQSIEFVDPLNQVTIFTFSHVERNLTFKGSLFEFKPDASVDVVGGP
jgi:outer membrane lipoprotein carrier protein